jgi:hypothetical protein
MSLMGLVQGLVHCTNGGGIRHNGIIWHVCGLTPEGSDACFLC